MPQKLERCVEEVIKKEGYEKSRAYAICTAALDGRSYISDFSPDISYKIDPTTGFMTLKTVVSRSGIQKYYGYELGMTDGDNAFKIFKVYRPPEEVFSRESLDTFINIPVTDDHPSELVTIDNVKELQKGQLSHVEKSGDYLMGISTITDKDLINKIKNGKVEVSVGYTNVLKDESGVFQGEKYDFVQSQIKSNHLAVVDKGRCGSACKLTFDSQEKTKMANIMISGVSFEVSDQVKQAFDAYVKDQEESAKKKEEEMEDMEEEKKKVEAQKDALQGQLDAEKKTALTDADIEKMVNDRAMIISSAQKVLTDEEFKAAGKDLKQAVIKKVMADIDLDGKSEDYIGAMFDVAIKQYSDNQAKTKALGEGIAKDSNGKEVTREGARAKYQKDFLGVTA